MRIGSFLAGGLIGAAAVYMMNGRFKGQLMSKMGMFSNSASNAALGSQNSNQATQSFSNEFSNELDGFKKVKQMISQDPELRQTIREIAGQKTTDTASASAPKL